MTQQTTAIKKVDEKKFEIIQSRILELEDTGLKFPPNYSPQNAARAAWLILQETQTRDKKPVLEACSQTSIANALLKMVTLGMNPIKKQGYFIAYGEKLEFQPSYQGTIATAKRHGLKKVTANLIYEGDDFNYSIDEDGSIKIKGHNQSFASLGQKIIGAYAVTVMDSGDIDTTIMTIDDIKKAWQQGATNGNSPAHKNFEGEMAKKTVIGRACKTIINSSDDAALFEGEEKQTPVEAHVNHQIKENANKAPMTFDDEPTHEVEEAQEEPAAQEEMPQMSFES